MNRHHHIACNLCEAICGLEIRVVDGEIASIRGDKQDPVSKGHICPKAIALQDVYNDPDRLRTPLRKTADGWQEISWKQAYNEVSEGLKKVQQQHGNDSVAVYLGNPSVHNMEALLFGPMFFRQLRTRNRYSATSVDQLPEQLVSLLMFGHSLLIPLPDLDRTDFHVMFGANPVVSNGSLMTAPGVRDRLKAIRKRGGAVVVVDPRRTETAAIADQHLFIKPGTDVLMLLAMLQVVFSEGLQSLGRVGEFTRGLEQIRQLVQPFTPEAVAATTGVDPVQVRTLTRQFCNAERASCYGRIGVSTQRFGTLCQWLITVLNTVTGNLDVPGGTMFSTPALDVLAEGARRRKGKSARRGFADRFTRVRSLPDFEGEFPVAALAEEMTTPGEGQVRALVTSAGNPVLSTPNGAQLDEAIAGLDFMVSFDIYLNETTRHADYILPPVCGLERPHYDLVFQALAIRNGARYSSPVFAPGPEQRTDREIFIELGWRMQRGGGISRVTAWLKKELLKRLGSDWMLNSGLKRGPYHQSHGLTLKKLKKHPHGIDLGPLQPSLPDRLFSSDGMIELAPAEFLEGIPQVEVLLSENGPSRSGSQFDLQLIGRRDPRTNNSWLHNSHRLVKGKPRCLALVNTADADARGIHDGDTVTVRSRVGEISISASLTDDIMPGVISIPHGWGHDLEGVRLRIATRHGGVNTNILTDEDYLDTLSGNAALNGVPVNLTRGADPAK